MGRTLGVVVAHPDDDAYGVAAVVALHLADPEFRFFLVHATDGEGGAIAEGSGATRETLGAVRRSSAGTLSPEPGTYGSGGACPATRAGTAFPAASLTAVSLTAPTAVSVTTASATTGGCPTIGAPHRGHTRAVTATSAAHSRHLICIYPAADAGCADGRQRWVSGLVTFDPERAARSRLNRVHASLSDYSNSSVGDEVIVSPAAGKT